MAASGPIGEEETETARIRLVIRFGYDCWAPATEDTACNAHEFPFFSQRLLQPPSFCYTAGHRLPKPPTAKAISFLFFSERLL